MFASSRKPRARLLRPRDGGCGPRGRPAPARRPARLPPAPRPCRARELLQHGAYCGSGTHDGRASDEALLVPLRSARADHEAAGAGGDCACALDRLLERVARDGDRERGRLDDAGPHRGRGTAALRGCETAAASSPAPSRDSSAAFLRLDGGGVAAVFVVAGRACRRHEGERRDDPDDDQTSASCPPWSRLLGRERRCERFPDGQVPLLDRPDGALQRDRRAGRRAQRRLPRVVRDRAHRGHLGQFPGGYKGLVEKGVDATTSEAIVRYLDGTRFGDELRIHVARRTSAARASASSTSSSGRASRTGSSPTAGPNHACVNADTLRPTRMPPGSPRRSRTSSPADQPGPGRVVGLRLLLLLRRRRGRLGPRLRPHADELGLVAVVRVPGLAPQDLAVLIDDPLDPDLPRRLPRELDDLSPTYIIGSGSRSILGCPVTLSSPATLSTRRSGPAPSRRTRMPLSSYDALITIQRGVSLTSFRSTSG